MHHTWGSLNQRERERAQRERERERESAERERERAQKERERERDREREREREKKRERVSERCGVDTEIPYRRLPFWREFCWVLQVRVDSGVKFHIGGFPFGENSAGFCKFVWIPGSILNFRIGSVSSIGGLIAATLFAATISDSQRERAGKNVLGVAEMHI